MERGLKGEFTECLVVCKSYFKNEKAPAKFIENSWKYNTK